MDVVENTGFCQICQSSDNLGFLNTSTTASRSTAVERISYLDLLEFIFKDILWTADSQISLACYSCMKKIEDTAAFKAMCVESNKRRCSSNVVNIKLEIVITKNDQSVEDDEATVNGSPEVDLMEYNQHSSVKIEKQNSKIGTKKRKLRALESTMEIKRKTFNCNKKSMKEIKPDKVPAHYHCAICKTDFKNLDKYDRHMNKHNGIRNYVCSICGRTYITKSDLQEHLIRHRTEAAYACKLCSDKKFRCSKDLGKHMAIVHIKKEDYKYECSQCGKKCSQLCTLKMHILRAHSKIRSFKCDVCDNAFFEKRDLTNHYTTHSNIRAFKCDLCSAEYKRKYLLQVHKARLHGIGSYKVQIKEKIDCRYCKKKIAKDKLARHIRTHTGEKPYSCRLCDTKFICNSYIKGHLKLKHDIDVEASDYDTKSYYNVAEKDLEDSTAIINFAK